jgi:hypothetical protein
MNVAVMKAPKMKPKTNRLNVISITQVRICGHRPLNEGSAVPLPSIRVTSGEASA